MQTIAQGIESGELNVGSKISIELEISEIDLSSHLSTKVKIYDRDWWLNSKEITYTKPVEVPEGCEMVAVPKFGSRWRSTKYPLSGEVKITGLRVVSAQAGWSISLEDFDTDFEPITKRTVSKQEAEEFFAKHGEEVEIV
jgi:hypothetical protein